MPTRTRFIVALLGLAACPADGDDGQADTSGDTTASSSATNPTTADSTMTITTDTFVDSSSGGTTLGSEGSSGEATSSGSTGDTEIGGCAQVELVGELYAPDADGPDLGVFRTTGELLGDAAFRDRISIDFFVDTTGMVDLASPGENDNYSTCRQCFRIIEDLDFDAGQVARIYFQAEGTMDIDRSSEVFATTLSASLVGVRLVEVTIDSNTFVSTPVPGGACAEIVDGTITGVAIPPGWTCGPTTYAGLDGCDCGCGLDDLDCLADTVDACNFCDDPGSCSTDACPGMIDPVANSMCM